MTSHAPVPRRLVVRGHGTGLAAAAASPLLGAPPVSAGPAARRATVRARRRFFGEVNVHPVTGAVRRDRVILSWFGCTSFAVAMNGTVVLLDAWVPRAPHSGHVPTDPDEVAALAPAAILVGHGHVDHAADVASIAGGSRAVVVGTAEHCAQAQEQAGGRRLRVRLLGSADTSPGTIHRFRVGGVGVTAVSHLHSALSTPDLEDPHTPDGGCLLYQLRMPGFRLAWNDSAGPLQDQAPEVLDVLRALPRSNVHVGTIQGLDQPAEGRHDPRTYIEALRAPVFVPCHHDQESPGVSTSGSQHEEPLHAELARIPEQRRPRVRFLTDPDDYLRPGRLTFRV